MKLLVICVTVVLFRLSFSTPEDGQIEVVHKHAVCSFNKQYIDKMTSTRKPVNRTMSIRSIDIYFRSDIILESPIYIQINANKKYATQYRPIMINYKLELCEFLTFKNHPLYNFLFSTMNKSESNLTDPCPLKGHRYVKPYYSSYQNLPPLLPVGMWRNDVIVTKKFKDREVEIFRFQDYYEITAKGIIEF